jgi:hypothetical protein
MRRKEPSQQRPQVKNFFFELRIIFIRLKFRCRLKPFHIESQNNRKRLFSPDFVLFNFMSTLKRESCKMFQLVVICDETLCSEPVAARIATFYLITGIL